MLTWLIKSGKKSVNFFKRGSLLVICNPSIKLFHFPSKPKLPQPRWIACVFCVTMSWSTLSFCQNFTKPNILKNDLSYLIHFCPNYWKIGYYKFWYLAKVTFWNMKTPELLLGSFLTSEPVFINILLEMYFEAFHKKNMTLKYFCFWYNLKVLWKIKFVTSTYIYNALLQDLKA